MTNWPPFDYRDENGEHLGISADLLQMAAERVGLKTTPVFGDWDSLLKKLLAGEVDLAPDIYYTENRAAQLAYTKPYLPLYTAVFAAAHSGIRSADDLANHRVAVEKSYAIEEVLPKEHAGVQLHVVKNTLEALLAVSTGQADAYVGTQFVASYLIDKHVLHGIEVVGLYSQEAQGLYMATPQDRSILRDIMDKALASISDKERRAVVRQYFSAPALIQKNIIAELSEEERAWIQSHKVRVGIEELAPIVFLRKDGRAGGLAGGFLERITEKTGLQFEFVGGVWDTLLQGLKNHDIDLLPATYYTEERATFGLYTKPYFSMREFIYVRQDSKVRDIDDLAHGRIAVVKGYGTIPKLRAQYPHATIIETQSLLHSINAVLNGEADALLEAQVAVEQSLRENALAGLKGISQDVFPAFPVHLFSRRDEPVLHTILQKGLDAISPSEQQQELSKWISTAAKTEDPGASASHQAPAAPQILLTTGEAILLGLLVVVAIGAILVFAWLLRSQRRAFLQSLRGKSVLFLAMSFFVVGGATLIVFSVIGHQIAIELGRRLAENHVQWLNEKMLSTVSRELALAKQMANSLVLQRWAVNEDDPAHAAAARVELQHFHDNFASQTYFIALTESRHFFYADKTTTQVELEVIDALSESDDDDSWFFTTLADPAPYNWNVDHNVKLGVTNLWVNYSMRQGDQTLGVVGTGIQLAEFIDEFINRGGEEVTAMMIDAGGAIQAHADPDKISRIVLNQPLAKDAGIWALLATEADRQQLRQQMTKLAKASREAETREAATFLVHFAHSGEPHSRSRRARRNGLSRSEQGVTFGGGREKLVAMTYIAPLKWYSVAIFDPRIIIGVREKLTLAMVFAAALLISAVIFVFGQNMLIVRPLLGLTEGARRMAQGDYSFRVPVAQKDEIGDLARSFNDMAATIADYTRNLEARVADRTRDLQESQARIYGIMENVADGIVSITPDGCIESVNLEIGSIFGYSPAELLGRNIKMLMPPGTGAHHDDYISRYLNTKTKRAIGQGHIELTGLHRDGHEFPMELSLGEVKIGDLHLFVGAIRDITRRKEAESKIVESEQRVRSLLASVGEGVFGVNTDGKIVFVNPQCAAHLGYTEAELLGQSAHALFHHSHADGSRYPNQGCWMYKSCTEGESFHVDNEVLWRQDGSHFPVEYHSTPVRRDGTLVGAVISFNDISERLKTQRERDDALDLINGSINYATHIQHSILPLDDCLSSLTNDHFVLWEPRDRVGGDMYWCKPWGMSKLIALGDCTGHGVPGAFMTLIANGALEMATLETRPGDAGALLQRTHTLIQDALNQDSDAGESDDGLELGLCYIHPKQPRLVFAGARFSLFHVDAGVVSEIKGDKRGIGYRGLPRQGHLTNHDVEISAGRAFYMTSDGLIDQIGGPKRRGFGKRRFIALLQDIQSLPMAEQQERIHEALTVYQGEEKRRDDVSVIGFIVDGKTTILDNPRGKTT
ncbi:PAS domain S-box protein [Rhabdochromatium marinum]|uniref:PAS domain S-box protein n=1 Tax=Rhabdochromatium marinum TaxID=48729 RepID=UPI001F5B4276|nr:transporter substrate-binding domain-containing protein [Rhabdochromatium marinum]